MDPKQMEDMMKMAGKMQGGGGGAPNMADMMKNMDPDALAGMAQSMGQPGVTPEMVTPRAQDLLFEMALPRDT